MDRAWKSMALAAVLAVGLAVLGGAQNQDWQTMSPAPLDGGYGLTTVSIGTGICIVEAQNKSDTPELACYDEADGWGRTMELEGLSFRNGTAMTWNGEALFALEGARYEDTGSSSRKGFYRVDLADNDNTMEELAATPGSQGAGNALTYAESDGHVYAFTGSNEHPFDFARYDPEADAWESDLAMPDWECTDDGASLAAVDGSVYALKGECSEETPNGDFARYDIESDEWQSLPDLPAEGCGVGDGGSLAWSEANPDILYATDGGCANEDPGDGFWRYYLQDHEWTELDPLPCPVGEYNGARLAATESGVFFWQGAPGSDRWACQDGQTGGDGFGKWTFSTDDSGGY